MAKTAEHTSEATVDLLHDLCRRRDCIWRFDQYISNCDGDTDLREYWHATKSQELLMIKRLTELLLQRMTVADF